MDASAENSSAGKKKKRRRRRRRRPTPKIGVSSPSALLAESASRRAADALARRARGGCARASLEADARELAARVRAAEAAAERAESGAEIPIRKERREKTFTPAFPAAVSDAALAAAAALRADGNASFRRGDVHAAIETFTEALAHVPDDVAALANPRRRVCGSASGPPPNATRARACPWTRSTRRRCIAEQRRGPAWGTTKAR